MDIPRRWIHTYERAVEACLGAQLPNHVAKGYGFEPEECVEALAALKEVYKQMGELHVEDASSILSMAVEERLTYNDASYIHAAMENDPVLVTTIEGFTPQPANTWELRPLKSSTEPNPIQFYEPMRGEDRVQASSSYTKQQEPTIIFSLT